MPSNTPTECWTAANMGECTCARDPNTGKMVWMLRDQTGGNHGEYCTTGGPNNELSQDAFNLQEKSMPGSQRVVEYVQQVTREAIETYGPDVALGALGAFGIGYTVKFALDNIFHDPHKKNK